MASSPQTIAAPNMGGSALPSDTARIFGAVAFFLVALGGAVALAAWSGITLEAALAAVVSAPLWLIASYAVLTIAQNMLSAWKWRAVMSRLKSPDEVPSMTFAHSFTALSAFLSQFLTAYASAMVVRGWAVRRNHGLTARFGATTSFYEQLFDVYVLSLMALPTIAVWTANGSFGLWLAVTTSVLVLGGFALFAAKGSCVLVADRMPRGPRLDGFAQWLRQQERAGLFGFGFMVRIYAVSVARYLTILVRVPLLVLAIATPIAVLESITSFTLVQASQIIAITPGQLGIREWTWSGILALRGYDLEATAQFAIVLRIFGLIGMTLALLVAVPSILRKSAR